MEETKDLALLVEEIICPVIVKAIRENLPQEISDGHRDYYTAAQVCEKLHISLPTLYKKFKDKTLTKYTIGGRTLIDKEEYDKAVEQKKLVRYKHKK